MKLKNIEMDKMLEGLKPILPHRDKIGYIAARNTRILREALTEYFIFKNNLIKKYGKEDEENHTVSIEPSSSNFKDFLKEFEEIGNIEHEVELMTIPYSEAIGLLNGEEILALDWMFTE